MTALVENCYMATRPIRTLTDPGNKLNTDVSKLNEGGHFHK